METINEFHRLIEMAIVEEQKAQRMYKDMAERADDPYARAIIEGLYEQEVAHEAKLRDLLESVAPVMA